MRKSTILAAIFLTLVLPASTCMIAHAQSEVLPWGVERVRAHCLWDNNMDMTVDKGANAGQGINIAIIDTGIYYWEDNWGEKHYHEDLADNVKGATAFRKVNDYAQEEDPLPDYRADGHGTHCTGIIGAVDNLIGVIGTAPRVNLYSLQMKTWDYLELVAAIDWSVDNGMNVISISFHWENDYPAVREACENAYENGLLLVAASGNDNDPVAYPAAYDYVVAVGAVYEDDTRWERSNYGSELEFVAPGVDVNSTVLNNGYGLLTGTSMACPHVSATAALIWNSKIDPWYDDDEDDEWSNTEVREKLNNMTLDLGSSGKDNYYGWGLINAWATNQRPLGDINIDYVVNILDITIASTAFGSYPGHPNWDPRADINIDNIINILDLDIIAQNFGQEDP